ncbi:lantibiotic dehydratase family protein [Elizabethkingia anophelis]|nr:lantibiotic dehydratase family protein [Elizabethkingia anophelis]MCT3824094.1 lantibiotic dehydratase family protein [Elizabethkingia anophelis]MCT3932335.1 lantibiotic dehydratase family protein [Elizabethkingia anophelis]MCT4113996.1 lantibiotic dehydratase family protein [Elizabethkingia anophelis]
MTKISYQFFNDFVVRRPFFNIKKLKEVFNTSGDVVEKIISNDVFLEAIYLSSPEFYYEVIKWKQSENKKQLPLRLKNTLLKYFIRMSSRSTPFGLFSGVDTGYFTARTQEKTFVEHSKFKRDTKPDMHFLVSLAKYLENIPQLKNKLLFYPNNSIYIVGDKIRYIEYTHHTGKREYIISSAPLSPELDSIIRYSQNGLTITQLCNLLVNGEITIDDAREFIDELIENQVLVSELEPNLTGNDFTSHIISVLEKNQITKELSLILEIQKGIQKLDLQTRDILPYYKKVEDLISKFPIEYEKKYLLQTDLYYEHTTELNKDWKKKLWKALKFLNKITLPYKDSKLIQFRNAFNKRFEDREIPLALALDTEIGIGYLQNKQYKGLHPYLNDLLLPEPTKKNLDLSLSSLHQVLNRKLQQKSSKENIIKLSDEDFANFQETWKDLPDTMSFISEIITEKGEEKLVFTGGGGNSGANLLARFCFEKHKIKSLVEAIIEKEEKLNPNSILAEIVHLPQSRVGNVLRRPTLRKYEILYLTKSSLNSDVQIPVHDLYISIKQDKIILRSKRLNKEIKPYLTNAHNYSNDALPVYHFLCDLSLQDKRSTLTFDWGDLEHIYHSLPRVEYDDIILSKAKWKVFYEEIQHLYLLKYNSKQLLEEVKKWREKRLIPNWGQWVVSDNKLVLDLQNYDTCLLFLETLERKKSIIIEEFLFHENEAFINEYIFTAYKTINGS